MSSLIKSAAVLILLFACCIGVSAADVPAAESAKPRVVCFGDSITKQGYPEVMGKALGVETINAGVGGNTTANALKRIQADVLDKKPTVVVVFFGTNDCRPSDEPVHVPVEKYQANLRVNSTGGPESLWNRSSISARRSAPR